MGRFGHQEVFFSTTKICLCSSMLPPLEISTVALSPVASTGRRGAILAGLVSVARQLISSRSSSAQLKPTVLPVTQREKAENRSGSVELHSA